MRDVGSVNYTQQSYKAAPLRPQAARSAEPVDVYHALHSASIPGGVLGQQFADVLGGYNLGPAAMALTYVGSNSQDVKGHLPYFEAAGGQTNNCADFVSSNLLA